MTKYILFLSFVCAFFGAELLGMEWGGYEYDLCADIAQLQRHQRESNQFKLWRAVVNDDIEQVKGLLETQDIDLESKEVNDETVLHAAAKEGNPDMVQLLLDKGANPKALTRGDHTPLHRAATAGNAFRNKNSNFPKVVAILLSKRVKVNVQNFMGITALHEAADNNDIVAIDEAVKATLCKQLLKAGANRYLTYNSLVGQNEGFTPLHVAAESNNPLAVQELLIFEPTTEDLQHLVPGAWVLKQLNLPTEIDELIKRKWVTYIVNEKVLLARAYMAITARGKTAYDIAVENKHTEVATMLDMHIDASYKALRLALVERIRELLLITKNQK